MTLAKGYGVKKLGSPDAVDADTIFHANAIEYLVRHFSDPRVGAVSGNAKVGNRHNWITRRPKYDGSPRNPVAPAGTITIRIRAIASSGDIVERS